MSGNRVQLRLAVPGLAEFGFGLPVEHLTAGLYQWATEEELAETDPAVFGRTVLKLLIGVGGVALSEVAEDFTLAAWSDTLTPADVARWDRCAARVAEVFAAPFAGPETAGAGVSG